MTSMYLGKSTPRKHLTCRQNLPCIPSSYQSDQRNLPDKLKLSSALDGQTQIQPECSQWREEMDRPAAETLFWVLNFCRALGLWASDKQPLQQNANWVLTSGTFQRATISSVSTYDTVHWWMVSDHQRLQGIIMVWRATWSRSCLDCIPENVR